MSQNQGDFTPVVKGGYKADGPLHRRNWRALSDFLRTNFVTNERLADGSVGEVKIQDLAVTDAKIDSLAVDKLTAGSLSADVVLGSTIKTAEVGQRVEIDANGIRLNDGTDDVVNIPVSGNSSFKGGVQATSLRSNDATLAGDTNIDGGGWMRFAQGVADPTVAPTISWTYTQTSISGVSNLRGVDYDATSSRLLGCWPNEKRIYGFPIAGGLYDTTYLFAYEPYGIVRMGSYIYVTLLSASSVFIYKMHLTAGGAPDSIWASLVEMASSPNFTNFDHLAGMTTDGTYIYVAWVNGADDVKVNKYDSSLVYQSTTTLESAFETGSRVVYDIEYENVDGGRWWVVWSNPVTNAYEVRAYDSTPARLAAEDFDLPTLSKGICYSGSAFITVPSAGTYYRTHSTWRSSSSDVHVKYTWRDTGGAYESVPSKQSYVTYVQRAFLRVSWPGFPGSADAVRVYFLEDNVTTTPSGGSMKRQSTESGSSQIYATYDSGGAADPTTSTFPAATPARLTFPVKNGAPGSPETGEIYFDSGTSKARIWDGAAWNNLW